MQKQIFPLAHALTIKCKCAIVPLKTATLYSRAILDSISDFSFNFDETDINLSLLSTGYGAIKDENLKEKKNYYTNSIR